MTSKRRIGLIVNPIAGMGGSVALKGTDGELAARAIELGAIPQANDRTVAALKALSPLAAAIEWQSVDGSMGSNALADAGFECDVIHHPEDGGTSADDTRAAAQAMIDAGVELIVFAGGDGTATDIHRVVEASVPILGIPSGVKMHSAVFALSPRAAGAAVRNFIEEPDAALVEDVELLDRPAPDAPPELLGYAKSLAMHELVSHGKAAGAVGSVDGACEEALEQIGDEDGLVLIGAGLTMQRLKQALGFEGTLLGVDAFRDGELVGEDLSATSILDLMDAEPPPAKPLLVVSIVGGQGFLFGRGNQQLSAEVLKRLGRERIVVVSSREKISALPRRQLWIDTGDESVDKELAGYWPVVIGHSYTTQIKVGPPSIED